MSLPLDQLANAALFASGFSLPDPQAEGTDLGFLNLDDDLGETSSTSSSCFGCKLSKKFLQKCLSFVILTSSRLTEIPTVNQWCLSPSAAYSTSCGPGSTSCGCGGSKQAPDKTKKPVKGKPASVIIGDISDNEASANTKKTEGSQ